MKKYEFTEETVTQWYGGEEVILHRIRALQNFKPTQMDGEVYAGDLGGFIEKEDNLSHEGNCWVDEEAQVMRNARITDNAYVCGNTLIFEDAIISENAAADDWAQVMGNVILKGRSLVHGGSIISGFVTLSDNVDIQDAIISTPQITASSPQFDAAALAESVFRSTISGELSIRKGFEYSSD